MPRSRRSDADSSPRRLAIAAPLEPSGKAHGDQLRTATPLPLTKRDRLQSTASTSSSAHRSVAWPATSSRASHTIVLQLQEYHDRLERALVSTYQAALQPPRRPQQECDDRAPSSRRKTSFCRARVLQSNRDCFQKHTSGAPPPAFTTPVSAKDAVLPSTADVYVSFHQTTPRSSDYLYSSNQESVRRMRLLDSMASVAGGNGASIGVTKDHFALGPGQYEIPVEKPSGLAAAAKFSPSDRFHELYLSDRPGPGQYLASETLVTPRPTSAVFSQKPRETDISSIISPTANVVSSYYYVPESDFSERPKTANRPVGWSRTARFQSHGRHARAALVRKPAKSSETDFIAKNMLHVHQNRSKGAVDTPAPPPHASSVKRRSTLVSALLNGSRATQATAASSFRQQLICAEPTTTTGPISIPRLRQSVSSRDRVELMLQSWITVTYIASFHAKLTQFYALTTALQRLHSLQNRKRLAVTFVAWKKLDVNRNRQYAAGLVAKNALRLRLWTRIQKKRRHASLLRQFLGGLSFDVRFALAMKRIKRKIQLIQRWWRHVQLMVRAREETLYHKWTDVENRMRLDYISQLPHMQRIFQPPAGTTASSATGGGSNSGASICGHGHSHASELSLHKLLYLPGQHQWFTGRFVLSSDGSIRGYATDDDDELLVEVKHFRCHYHDVSGCEPVEGSSGQSNSGDHRASYTNYTNTAWKPFLMLFRQGAFRFVLVASLSPLPTEVLSWKDKLEKLMVHPTGSIRSPSFSSCSSMSTSSASFRGSSASSMSYSDLSFFGSVSDLVEVSMQSGILAPTATGETQGSSNSHRRPSRVQARVRSIHQRSRSGVSVMEGTLSYYVVDLLKDLPKVPSALVWSTIRDKLRENRKAFRAEIYRYKLEMFHYQQHQQQVQHVHVLEKFRDFFTLERPRRPHFRSLISNSKMESLIRSTVDFVKTASPSNPRLLLDSATAKSLG